MIKFRRVYGFETQRISPSRSLKCTFLWSYRHGTKLIKFLFESRHPQTVCKQLTESESAHATSARCVVSLLHNDSVKLISQVLHRELVAGILRRRGQPCGGAVGALGRAARRWWRGRPAGAPSGGPPTWRRRAVRWRRRTPTPKHCCPQRLVGTCGQRCQSGRVLPA